MRYIVEVKFGKDLLIVDHDTIIVGIKAPPEKGKANLELIKKLAKYYDIPSSQVRILTGFKSKKKIVDIQH